MHCRLIVLVQEDGAESSLDARQTVEAQLMNQSFVGEGGLFASPPADWFVIGGRWSGSLTQLRLDRDRLSAFWKEFDSQRLGWVGRNRPEEQQKTKALELFAQFFPDFEGEPPVWRDAYERLGYEDDAQILDETLFRFLKELKGYPQEAGLDDLYRGRCYVDLDQPHEELTSDAIGKKWCVVVDFHY